MNLRRADCGALAVIGLCAGLQYLHTFAGWDLASQRDDIAAGAWWQLISGQLIHNNGNHLSLNMAGALLLYLLARDFDLETVMVTEFIAVLPFTGLYLYLFAPELQWYVGISGALHGGIVVLAVALIQQQHKLFGGILLAGLVSKLIWESSAFYNDSNSAELIGINVATDTHLWGTIAGVTTTFGRVLIELTTKGPISRRSL